MGFSVDWNGLARYGDIRPEVIEINMIQKWLKGKQRG